VIRRTKKIGFESDENGKMVKPPNFGNLNAEMLKKNLMLRFVHIIEKMR